MYAKEKQIAQERIIEKMLYLDLTAWLLKFKAYVQYRKDWGGPDYGKPGESNIDYS